MAVTCEIFCVRCHNIIASGIISAAILQSVLKIMETIIINRLQYSLIICA